MIANTARMHIMGSENKSQDKRLKTAALKDVRLKNKL